MVILVTHSGGADKSLAWTRKETVYSDQTLTFASHSKKKSESRLSNQVSAVAVTSALDEKWRPFNCFFSRLGLRTYQHPLYKNPKSHIFHYHHVHEGLDVFPVPWSSRCSWSLHLFLGRPTYLRPFSLYCSACFGSLFVSILCTCCSHFSWYCFISFTMFCAPVFPLIRWLFS